MSILSFCIRDLRRRPTDQCHRKALFTKNYWSPGPEISCSPVLIFLIRRRVLTISFHYWETTDMYVSELDNLRTHQPSSVQASWSEGGQLRESFQKREGHGIPVSWSGRRKQVPGIRRGTRAQETRDQACLIQAQDPQNQAKMEILVLMQVSYHQPIPRHCVRRAQSQPPSPEQHPLPTPGP